MQSTSPGVLVTAKAKVRRWEMRERERTSVVVKAALCKTLCRQRPVLTCPLSRRARRRSLRRQSLLPLHPPTSSTFHFFNHPMIVRSVAHHDFLLSIVVTSLLERGESERKKKKTKSSINQNLISLLL